MLVTAKETICDAKQRLSVCVCVCGEGGWGMWSKITIYPLMFTRCLTVLFTLYRKNLDRNLQFEDFQKQTQFWNAAKFFHINTLEQSTSYLFKSKLCGE